MNKEEILSVLYELHKITGFRISLHDASHKEIAAYPEKYLPFCAEVTRSAIEKERCSECDRAACRRAIEDGKTYKYRCRYGLTEAVSPLYSFDTLTGYLMMGQILETGDAVRLGSNYSLLPLVDKIPRHKKELIDSYVRVMTICAKYLTSQNAIEGTSPTVAMKAKRYILENLSSKLSLSEIAESIECSRSTLLSTFKKSFGTTVNAFITDTRLKRAKQMLLDGDHTINEVALSTGFYDQSYFSKVFSKEYGITPSEFRAQIQKKKHTEEDIYK